MNGFEGHTRIEHTITHPVALVNTVKDGTDVDGGKRTTMGHEHSIYAFHITQRCEIDSGERPTVQQKTVPNCRT